MRTYRVCHVEYRISLHRVVTNVEAPSEEDAQLFARNGQGVDTSREELHSIRAGDMTGFLDHEVGMAFLRATGEMCGASSTVAYQDEATND